MRYLAALLILVLLFGCLQPQEKDETVIANNTGNQTPANISYTNISSNETIVNETILVDENVTFIGENNTLQNQTNQTTNETNQTAQPQLDGVFFGSDYVLIINDVAFYGNRDCAIVTIAYENGTEIKKDIMCPSTDYYWTAPDGQRFRIKVLQVAAGYTGEHWARVIIYG